MRCLPTVGMATFHHTAGGERHVFDSLAQVLACASPRRSGDELAGIAAASDVRRVAARMALADLPLTTFLNETVIPYDADNVTRLILDTHDLDRFAPVASMTVGSLREHLLAHETDTAALTVLARGITPEMAAAVSKIMRNQDLIVVAAKCHVETAFRSTLGLPGRISSNT